MSNQIYLAAIMFSKAIIALYAAFKSITIPFWVINKINKKQ